MTELPPYTGKSSKRAAPAKPKADEPASAPEGPPQPAFPVTYAPALVTWHSRVVLIAVAAFAVLATILTIIGGLGFPGGPIEAVYWFGLIVDLVAVAIVVTTFTVVEYRRRRMPGRLAQPVNTRLSVFAIVGVALSVIALLAWGAGGGLEQLVMLLQGVRTRYMYATGGLFFAGFPWALGAIFGAWGYRPRAHTATNVLALVAIVIWAALAATTLTHALVYGAGLSD